MTPNGPPLTKYTVFESRNGGAWPAIGTTSPDHRNLGHTTVYDGASLPLRRHRHQRRGPRGTQGQRDRRSPRSASPQVPGQPNVTTPAPTSAPPSGSRLGDSRSGVVHPAAVGERQRPHRHGRLRLPGGRGQAVHRDQLGPNAQTPAACARSTAPTGPSGRRASNTYTPVRRRPRRRPTSSATATTTHITWRWNLHQQRAESTRSQFAAASRRRHAGDRNQDGVYASTASPGDTTRSGCGRTLRGGGWSRLDRLGRGQHPEPAARHLQRASRADRAVRAGSTGSCRDQRLPGGAVLDPRTSRRARPTPCAATTAANGGYTSSVRLRVNGSGDGYSWGGSCVSAVNGGTMTVHLGGTSDSASW